jgi:hypothetical protein
MYNFLQNKVLVTCLPQRTTLLVFVFSAWVLYDTSGDFGPAISLRAAQYPVTLFVNIGLDIRGFRLSKRLQF